MILLLQVCLKFLVIENYKILKTKLIYVLSDIDKAVAFEWIVQQIDKEKIELNFVLLNDKESYIEKFLIKNNIHLKRIYLKTKKDYPQAFISLVKEINLIKPDIIHTHLFDANVLGLLASKILGIKKRIYTRHHSTFHHDNFPKAVILDKMVNYLATDIIAISKNVKNILIEKESVKDSKITLIHHGFDLKSFENVNENEIQALRQKYIPHSQSPVIGVIARYINWKGHKSQVQAFKKILNDFPNAFFLFANAKGPNKKEISDFIKQNIPQKNYIEIEFENNLFALYKLFDVYVHTPVNSQIEAFGQTYIEALASGVPSVFTISGIANEFIENNKNALVVDYNNPEQIYNSISKILKNDSLQKELIDNGKKAILQFSLRNFIHKLEHLYLK